MNDANKKIASLVAGFVIGFVAIFVVGQLLVDKVSDRVIEKLQREYSPGPYDPGFDPDKVPSFQPQGTPKYMGTPEDWNQLWESQRR